MTKREARNWAGIYIITLFLCALFFAKAVSNLQHHEPKPSPTVTVPSLSKVIPVKGVTSEADIYGGCKEARPEYKGSAAYQFCETNGLLPSQK